MDINEDLEKIEAAVNGSALSAADKTDLLSIVRHIKDPSMMSAIADLFTSKPFWIAKMSDNYKAKRSAFITNDLTSMESIVAEEVSELEGLET